MEQLEQVLFGFVVSARVTLLNGGCPAAVARFVVAIWIDPINGMFGCWFASHIVQRRSFIPSPEALNQLPDHGLAQHLVAAVGPAFPAPVFPVEYPRGVEEITFIIGVAIRSD